MDEIGVPGGKPHTCRKSLMNLPHNVVLSTPRHERGSRLITWAKITYNLYRYTVIFISDYVRIL